MTTDPLLSVAITAYLGWPKARTRAADRRAVLELAKGAEAGQLVEMVRSRRYVPFRATPPADGADRDQIERLSDEGAHRG